MCLPDNRAQRIATFYIGRRWSPSWSAHSWLLCLPAARRLPSSWSTALARAATMGRPTSGLCMGEPAWPALCPAPASAARRTVWHKASSTTARNHGNGQPRPGLHSTCVCAGLPAPLHSLPLFTPCPSSLPGLAACCAGLWATSLVCPRCTTRGGRETSTSWSVSAWPGWAGGV